MFFFMWIILLVLGSVLFLYVICVSCFLHAGS